MASRPQPTTPFRPDEPASGSPAAEPADRLLDLARDLLSETGPGALLDRALDGLIELTGAERGLIAWFDDGGRPRFEAARHLAREDLEDPRFEVSRTLIETVRTTGEPIWRANALDDPALGERESVIRLRILSVICLPLRGPRADGDGGEDRHGGDGVFGVVYLDNRSLQGDFHGRPPRWPPDSPPSSGRRPGAAWSGRVCGGRSGTSGRPSRKAAGAPPSSAS